VGQKQAELITTQTGQTRLGAAERFQQPGHLHQQAIAGGMAGGVVDDLELVEVDVEERVARLTAGLTEAQVVALAAQIGDDAAEAFLV
jgi:hypothetical protein